MLKLSALWALKLANNCGSCALLAEFSAIPWQDSAYNNTYPSHQADAAKDPRQCHAHGRRSVVSNGLHGGHGDDRAHRDIGMSEGRVCGGENWRCSRGEDIRQPGQRR